MTIDDLKNTPGNPDENEPVFKPGDFMHELSNRTQNGALRYLNYVDAVDCAKWANLKICLMEKELRVLRAKLEMATEAYWAAKQEFSAFQKAIADAEYSPRRYGEESGGFVQRRSALPLDPTK